jgi:hypothetical protein
VLWHLRIIIWAISSLRNETRCVVLRSGTGEIYGLRSKRSPRLPLEKRAEATYAEYRRQKASGSGGRGFRLPLC